MVTRCDGCLFARPFEDPPPLVSAPPPGQTRKCVSWTCTRARSHLGGPEEADEGRVDPGRGEAQRVDAALDHVEEEVGVVRLGPSGGRGWERSELLRGLAEGRG